MKFKDSIPWVGFAFGNGCVQYLILHENQRASLSRVGQHSLCLFLYFKEKFVFVFQGKIRSLCYCEIEDLISPHPYSWSVQFQFESRRERLKNTSYLSILVHQRKFSTAGRGGLGLIWAMGWKDQNLTDWTIWLHFPFGLPAYWAIFTGWGVSDAFFFNNALLSQKWEP